MEPIVVGYLLLMNIVGLYVMYSDKRRAIKHRFRIPERTLFIVSLLGGSIGTWAGMYLFRHKTKTLVFCCRNAFDLVVSVRGCSILSVHLIGSLKSLVKRMANKKFCLFIRMAGDFTF